MRLSDRIVEWIETTLIVPEGKLVGQPVRLLPWQKKIIRDIYDNPAKTRTALISFGRKNGKTALAAMLCLVHLCGPMAKPNSQLYSAARSRDQAAILYNLASKMVAMSPKLKAFVTLRETAKEMVVPQLGTFFKALSADATTKYGMSPIFVVHDELGQVVGPKDALYSALESGMGAHDSPLSLVISTQARTDADLLSVLIDDALKGDDPRTVVCLFTADPKRFKDPFSLEAIKAANPAFGIFQNAEEILRQAEMARRIPSLEPEFRNLNLNQRVTSWHSFIEPSLWQACAGHPVLIGGVFLGLDLSEVRDLTAEVALANQQGVWQVSPTFWLPSKDIKERSDKDRVPWDEWADAGHLQLTPGSSISYKHVAGHVHDMTKKHDVKGIGFDRWNWRHFKPWLVEDGMSEAKVDRLFQSVGMGEASMTPALRTLEEDIVERHLLHGAHPILNMCMTNAVAIKSPTGSRKLDKAKSCGRIDGAVALAIARAVAAEKSTTKGAPRIRQL